MDAISLFSGAGGMDVGFEKAGFNVLWANDIDKNACETYSKNFTNKIVCGDVNDYLSELEQFSGIDVIFGGPPCQGFSVAGKMNPDDERSQLVWSFMKAVEIVQPKSFVMENVKSLATLSKFSSIRKNLFSLAQKMGYTFDLCVVNSKDFGIPQSRERMFFVGIKSKSEFKFSDLIKKYQCAEQNVRDVIFSLGKAGSKTNPKICNAKITIAKKPVLRKSPYAGMLFNGQGRPVDLDKPSCTIHASMGGNRTPIIDEKSLFEGSKSWVEEYHSRLMQGEEPLGANATPDYLRRLTVDEAQRLQTFPEDFIFEGRQSSVYRQIGNAVPCKLAEAVASALKDLLRNKQDISEGIFQFSFQEKQKSFVCNEELKKRALFSITKIIRTVRTQTCNHHLEMSHISKIEMSHFNL